jgi:uncharacterized protein (TIGR00369 family)
MVALPKVNIDTDLHKNQCFGCGEHNPIGLKLKFKKEDKGVVRAECAVPRVFQGWPGLVHGGILSLLLDEAMNNVAYHEGVICITASMDIRLRQPVKVEVPLTITGKITKHTRKLLATRATVCLQDGTVVAESTSKQYIV